MSGDPVQLTEAQIEAIAERAAKKALTIVYADVGRGVIRKLVWLTGIVVVGLALWLASKGELPGMGK